MALLVKYRRPSLHRHFGTLPGKIIQICASVRSPDARKIRLTIRRPPHWGSDVRLTVRGARRFRKRQLDPLCWRRSSHHKDDRYCEYRIPQCSNKKKHPCILDHRRTRGQMPCVLAFANGQGFVLLPLGEGVHIFRIRGKHDERPKTNHPCCSANRPYLSIVFGVRESSACATRKAA